MITVLTLQDLQTFYGCSKVTALKRKAEIKKHFGMPAKKNILLNHLANYERLTINEVLFILRGN
ncbi:MAG: hypothetical protein QM751_06195 [Paludibacteraceae bacterium]